MFRKLPFYGEFFEDKDKKVNKEVFFSVGSNIVKVKVEASRRDGFVKHASLVCTVLEVNGVTVPVNDSAELAEKIAVTESSSISQEKCFGAIRDALANFGLQGQIKPVSEEMARGQIRVALIRKRINSKKTKKEADL